MSDEEESWSSEEEEQDPIELTRLVSRVSYNIISEKELANTQMNLVNQVSDRFGITQSQATHLLISTKWDLKKVIREAEGGDTLDRFVCIERSSSIPTPGYCCMICDRELPNEALISLECHHFFCRECYAEYLKTSLDEGVACVFTTCPMSDCPLIVTETLFKLLLTENLFKLYRKQLLSSFVDLNASIKWCPGKDCTFAVEFPKMTTRNITCKCGFSWCFYCRREAHEPISCKQLVKWNQLSNDEDIDSQWMFVHSKPCPSCHSNIEKNEGCMHMTCKCKHEFC